MNSAFRVLTLILPALLAGCVTSESEASHGKIARARTDVTPTDADRRPPPVPERNRVLVDYRSGLNALRAGHYDEAKARFDDAIVRIGGIITNDAEAARAR